MSKFNEVVNPLDHLVSLPIYKPSEKAWKVLVNGAIVAQSEMPQDMLGRVINALFSVEAYFNVPPEVTSRLAQEFASYLVDSYCMLGTPILTNADRYDTALSSCAIIPIDLNSSRQTDSEEQICAYYQQNMGSGFNLTNSPHPILLLRWLDALCSKETATGNYDRYIGNMGLLQHLTSSNTRICSMQAQQ